MYLPLYTLGMANPDTVIWVPLFDDYQEQSDIPFAVFQATLQVSLATLRVMLRALVQSASSRSHLVLERPTNSSPPAWAKI